MSHNLDAVQRLCGRCVQLDHGEVVRIGNTDQVISSYLSTGLEGDQPKTNIDLAKRKRSGTGAVHFQKVKYWSSDETIGWHPFPEGPLFVHICVEVQVSRAIESFAVTIRSVTGSILINADVIEFGDPLRLNEGLNEVIFRFEALHLGPGIYDVGLWAGDALGTTYDHLEHAFKIQVVARRAAGFGVTPIGNGTVFCRFTYSSATDA